MVHDELHTLGVGILVECLYVEVGIRRLEVEHIVFLMSEPVFPTDVPSFHEHGVETVLGGKVDISAHVGIVGSMQSVGLHLGIVDIVELYRWQVEGIRPLALAGDHLPPHTVVLYRMYPAGIRELAGLVEVEDEVRSQRLAGIIGHHHRAPGRLAGSLQIALVAAGIGREPRLEGERLWVKHQVHATVVHQCSLVEVDVQSVGGLHLQGCLHASRSGERL